MKNYENAKEFEIYQITVIDETRINRIFWALNKSNFSKQADLFNSERFYSKTFLPVKLMNKPGAINLFWNNVSDFFNDKKTSSCEVQFLKFKVLCPPNDF